MGKILYDSTPIPNTGVPGVVGGYSIERLLKASGDGKIEPKAKIGDIVEKGQIVAYTGGKPVYAGVAGVVRGMLQAGINVKTGLKIGDVDPRKDISLVYKISDKSNLLGMQAYKSLCWQQEDPADMERTSSWQRLEEVRCSGTFLRC